MNPLILVGVGALLLCLGLGLGYWLAQGQRKREASRADDVQAELDDYRREVTEHFGETAQRFQDLGEQYRSLMKHMATGANDLCDPTTSDALLGFSVGGTPLIEATATAAEESAIASEGQTTDEVPDQPEAVAYEAPRDEPAKDYAVAEEADVSNAADDVQASTADGSVDAVGEEEISLSAEESPAAQRSDAANQDTAAADIDVEAQVDDVVIEPTVEPTAPATANGAQRTVH
ncbi:MAG: DUF1043 family protein [Pseudomonadota bacterium]